MPHETQIAIAQAVLAVSAALALILLAYLFRAYLGHKPQAEIGTGDYIAEVRVHINSFSEVVYREYHSTPESARRFSRLRAAEYREKHAAKLPAAAIVRSDSYIANASEKSLKAIWPVAETSFAR